MTQQPLENVRIGAFDLMPSPEEIHARVPLSEKASDSVFAGREIIKAILDRKDPRIFVVVGPCSIHDPIAGYDYAQRLKKLADEEPDNVEAQYHLGLFSWQTGQYDKAMERFRKTIELDGKEYPDAYAYLGQAYASLDSTDKALAALETYKTLVTDTALINGADRFIADIKNKHQH